MGYYSCKSYKRKRTNSRQSFSMTKCTNNSIYNKHYYSLNCQCSKVFHDNTDHVTMKIWL